jgi:hypothetical protein
MTKKDFSTTKTRVVGLHEEPSSFEKHESLDFSKSKNTIFRISRLGDIGQSAHIF